MHRTCTFQRISAQSASNEMGAALNTHLPSVKQNQEAFLQQRTTLGTALTNLRTVIDDVFTPAEISIQNWIANDATPMLEAVSF